MTLANNANEIIKYKCCKFLQTKFNETDLMKKVIHQSFSFIMVHIQNNSVMSFTMLK